jgi:hypothetical protein
MPSASHLTRSERLLVKYASVGKVLDLRTGDSARDDTSHGQDWGRERIIRASVVARLLHGVGPTTGCGVPYLRLTGARIVGHLDLAGADIVRALRFEHCYIEESPDLTDSRLRSIHIVNSRLPGLDAERLRVDGQFNLNRSIVDGPLKLVNARISGELTMNGVSLFNPNGWTLFAGGLTVDGALFGRRGFRSLGAIRLTGAHLNGGCFLDNAVLSTEQADALVADNLIVEGRMVCEGLTADGAIRLPGAQINGQLTWDGATIRAKKTALDFRRLVAQELILTFARPIESIVDLGYAYVAVLRDDPATWPKDIRLEGFRYESLITVTEEKKPFEDPSKYVSDVPGPSTNIMPARSRLVWLHRNAEGYRPQPYEQLAAFYRRMGHDDQARIVLLAKQRHRRSTQGYGGKVWAYLLDWSVGYGYRPWLAALWLAMLVAAGTIVFARWPPQPINPGKPPEFSSLAYTINILLPFGQFVQPDSWTPVGAERWFAYALVGAGWLLATAVIAGVTRVLNRS